MNGKGSKPRPLSISRKEFGERYDAIAWPSKQTYEFNGLKITEHKTNLGTVRFVEEPKRIRG